jgi:hypothetical protein
MTTGQPIKVPSDRNKYNNEFMENLRLQIKLNDQNLQANRLFLKPKRKLFDMKIMSKTQIIIPIIVSILKIIFKALF